MPMRGIRGNVPMPMIGAGTWQYNDTVAEASVLSAFGVGYRHVDTAYDYGNQVGVGRALKKAGLRRDEYFVTSKIPGGLNSSASTAALDTTLGQLGLDYVDLMLLHWPSRGAAARQEQWLALERWAKAGRARAIGVSHYCRKHLDDILSVASAPVALNQNQYHVGMGRANQSELHDMSYMQSKGVVYMSYSTLCGPCPSPDNTLLLTGPLVADIGKSRNKSGSQIALKWVVQQGIPVIPKSASLEHIKSNFKLFDFELTSNEMHRLSAATAPAETGTLANPDDAQDCRSIEEERYLVV